MTRHDLEFAVVHDSAFLVATGRARNRLWTSVQRAIRRAPSTPGRPAHDRETLTRISRADLGCAYAAPGIFEVETSAARVYMVVVTDTWASSVPRLAVYDRPWSFLPRPGLLGA